VSDAEKKSRTSDGDQPHGQSKPKRPGPMAMALLVLSGLVMIAGVALGVTGTLKDEAAVQTIQQQQAAATEGQTAPGADMSSGFVGQGGGVTFPFPVPGLPGSTSEPATTPEGEPTGEVVVQAAPDDPWSPAIFRMGFSFFVGFAMAFALRSFAKVTLVSAGIFFLLLFGLQYAGLVEVKWTAMADRYDSIQAWLKAQMGGFQAFVTGYLPSAGAGLAGLGLGFIRK
jgi:uncharacterized membrane protein (Fun14 family)